MRILVALSLRILSSSAAAAAAAAVASVVFAMLIDFSFSMFFTSCVGRGLSGVFTSKCLVTTLDRCITLAGIGVGLELTSTPSVYRILGLGFWVATSTEGFAICICVAMVGCASPPMFD